MKGANVINIRDYFKNRPSEESSKDSEQYECDCYEEFVIILETYFATDTEEYKLMLECYEDIKNRLTGFYKESISSVICNPNNFSILAEDSFGEIAMMGESDMSTEFICEREACCMTLNLLWILNRGKV